MPNLFRDPPPTMAEESGNPASSDKDVEKNFETGTHDETASASSCAWAQRQAVHVDPVLEKRVVRKFDLNAVPLVMILYLLSFLDRSNIGNARIAGMATDLDLVGNRYQWLLTIFYIAYILFEFQVLMYKIMPPHVWLAFVTFGWGLVATCQAGVHNWSGIMALRFLLGAFEAGFGPGIPYLLSFYYLRHELGFRCGIFLAAAPFATCFAGALAYAITSGHSRLANWRLLFLVEGLPTLCMAPIAWFFLPDEPGQARYLTEEEKVIAKARGVRQVGKDAKRIGGVDWKDVFATLLDAKAWFTALMYFSCNVAFSSLPVFLPTILAEMGFTAVNAQGLEAPPFFLSGLITIASTWFADRTQQRAYTLVFLSALGGAGYIMLAVGNSVAVRYTGCFLAAAGIFPSIANILPWVMNNQGSDTRRGMGIVMLNLVGQCGPLLGTTLYPTNEGPRYLKGHAVCAAFMFFTTLLVIGLRILLVWENKSLDRRFGTLDWQKRRMREETPVVEQAGRTKEEGEGVENYGPLFRYVL